MYIYAAVAIHRYWPIYIKAALLSSQRYIDK